MSNLTITTTSFDSIYEDTSKVGSYPHSYYVLHNMSVFNAIVVSDGTDTYKFDTTYQTGCSYKYNDYNCLNEHLEFHSGDPVLEIVSSLEEADFEPHTDCAEEVLEDIKKFCPIIDTVDKLYQLYEAFRDNTPHYLHYIGDRSDDLSDYHTDYEREGFASKLYPTMKMEKV